MSSPRFEDKLINKEMDKLKNHIRLKVFTNFITDENGKKRRNCINCNKVLSILNKLEKASLGKLMVEEISTKEDPVETRKYNIKNIPTIIFSKDNNKELIKYTASLDGNQLIPFIKTIQYYSGISPFYKDQIMTNLNHINKSEITLFITQTCSFCPQVIPIVNSFALISNGKIIAEIIDIEANSDIAIKYNITSVPDTMINKKEHIYGAFTPQDLLEKLTRGKRDFSGMYS
ncbi:MAG: thioredoxin family protein [Candidatus Lokiarchaeota archaeon]|nr:thioredoxin family protein [Candidatus Lokiarchaeota archaeon]